KVEVGGQPRLLRVAGGERVPAATVVMDVHEAGHDPGTVDRLRPSLRTAGAHRHDLVAGDPHVPVVEYPVGCDDPRADEDGHELSRFRMSSAIRPAPRQPA